jgi:hypothetical protein
MTDGVITVAGSALALGGDTTGTANSVSLRPYVVSGGSPRVLEATTDGGADHLGMALWSGSDQPDAAEVSARLLQSDLIDTRISIRSGKDRFGGLFCFSTVQWPKTMDCCTVADSPACHL